jgi:hypothetical protein
MTNKIMMAMLLGLMTSGCTANAPADGVCQKTCGSRPIGGGKIGVVPISSGVSFKNCKAGETLPTQTYRYLVYHDTSSGSGSGSTTGSTSGSTSGSTAGAGASADPNLIASRIPIPGIAFTPEANGFLNVTSDSSQWCTDSCGVAEVSFSPTCFEQDANIGILVPGMLYDDGSNSVPSIKFSVSME